MSLLLLLACLCGAAARGATARGSQGVSLRPEGGFVSWRADAPLRNRGWGASTDDHEDDEDDDFMARQECWSQMRSCLADIGEFATPDYSADGVFIANDVTIREAVSLWCQNSTRSAAEETYGHISTWETGSVTNMDFLFCVREDWMEGHTWGADIREVHRRDLPFFKDACVLSSESFNDDIGAWNTSSVTSMHDMFYGALSFDQPIGKWDVGKVTNMQTLFYKAYSFDQPIGGWRVDRVTDMSHMFHAATSFNQPLGDWRVDRVTDMSHMFAATSFNQPLGNWSVERVIDMSYMFDSAAAFNQDIGGWPINNVANMESMFISASAFDQDLGDWRIDRVANMDSMFYGASSFDQDLDWCVRDDVDLDNAFDDTKCASTDCGVNKPRCQRGSKHKNDKEVKKGRNIAFIIASVLFACLLLLGCVLGSYRRKRTELELERSEIVQEQCNAARDQIQEFQAHFVTIAGPRFLAFDRLRPHEECRESDELIVYDLVADVHDASTRGEVFIFFSHQWLGWSEPDPQRIHVKAMQQAVRAVSADTDTPLEKIRVWVDYVSIPQKNLRERALAIASLPTFASVSD